MNIAPGVRLGPYEIVAPLGSGGMGEVYRARDTRLDRTVAIKVLPPQLAADPQLRERFEREARAVSSLQHPHICALFDVGREGGTDFLVLEFLEGETLADRLARAGAIPVADALRIAIEFGAVLFEMLTGRTAFEGKTRASLLGAILKDEPPRISTLQPLAPHALDRIVSTCLAKDPDDRYQSARDLLRDLKWVASGAAESRTPAPAAPARHITRTGWAIVATLSILMLAAAFIVQRLRPSATGDPIQFTIVPPAGTTFATLPGGGTGSATQVAVSPDGRLVVFVANSQA